MWKLSDLIGEFEEPESISVPGLRKEVPIEAPRKLEWAIRANPNRLTRMFKFSKEANFNAFLLDVLEHQSETQHHGRLTVQYPQVKIEVWTHSLNDVTEIDFEWANAINEIYEGYNE
tara:strand:- start:468 stop:818 length:351 start_codon:yes stop_codon:yes gene_type:complete